MKKKILFFTFLVFIMLVITSFTSAVSISEEKQYFILESKECVDLNYENTTLYGFVTFGPNDPTISDVTYQNGTFQNRSLFWYNLRLTIQLRLLFVIFPLTRPIGFLASDIDFTVEYKQDIPQDSREKYNTYIFEIVNGNFTNNIIDISSEKHTIKVEGFIGGLILLKTSILAPPSFVISGICDRYILI